MAGTPCWPTLSDGPGPARSRLWKSWVGAVLRARPWLPKTCGNNLDILPEHRRVFRRILEMLGRAGVVEETSEGFDGAPGPG